MESTQKRREDFGDIIYSENFLPFLFQLLTNKYFAMSCLLTVKALAEMKLSFCLFDLLSRAKLKNLPTSAPTCTLLIRVSINEYVL